MYWHPVRNRRIACRTRDNLGIWRRIRRYILGRYPAIWRLFSWNSHTFGKFSRTERCRRNGRARLDSRTETESEFWTTMLEALGKVPLLLSEHFQMFLHIITILKGCYQLSFILVPVMHALSFGSSPPGRPALTRGRERRDLTSGLRRREPIGDPTGRSRAVLDAQARRRASRFVS